MTPTPANPDFPSSLAAIHVSDYRYLWVVSWIPQDDAQEYAHEVVLPGGRRILDFDDWNAVYDAVIEVVDLETGTIVARKTHPQLIAGFLGAGFAHGPLPMDDGSPRVAIWRASLELRH